MATQMDNMIVRVESIKTHDSNGQQQLEAWGRHGERYGGTTGKHAVPRVQGYGFSSHSPKGSQGVTLNLNGNPDNAMMIGMEHPEHRPKNLAEGEWKLYDKWGHWLWARPPKWYINVMIEFIGGLGLRASAPPEDPSDGDIWFDGTSLRVRVGGRNRRLRFADDDEDQKP